MFFSKRQVSIVALFLVLMFTVGTALADELEERQQQLEIQQGKAAQAQSKMAAAQNKVDGLSEQLRVIQLELDTAKAEYTQIQKQLATTEQQIKTNEIVLAKAEQRLSERTGILNKRMRDIYEHGQISYLDVVLSASDFDDFVTRMDILKRIIKQDIDLVAQVKAERELIVQKRTELENDRAAILNLQKAAGQKKQIIEERKKQQQKLLDQAVNERDVAEQAYNEQLETSKQIERMIRNLKRGNAPQGPATGSGALMWPTGGPITSPFGWRIHPIFGTQRYHSGIDIGADYGEPVVAADGGVVISADWMGGYGKAVIVDHGNGISTLYAHNSELVVSEGEKVRKGQTISYVGSTGYSTGPHLHFEVRQDGSPVDPTSYLP